MRFFDSKDNRNVVAIRARLSQPTVFSITAKGKSFCRSGIRIDGFKKGPNGMIWQKPFWLDLISFDEAADELSRMTTGDWAYLEGYFTVREWVSQDPTPDGRGLREAETRLTLIAKVVKTVFRTTDHEEEYAPESFRRPDEQPWKFGHVWQPPQKA